MAEVGVGISHVRPCLTFGTAVTGLVREEHRLLVTFEGTALIAESGVGEAHVRQRNSFAATVTGLLHEGQLPAITLQCAPAISKPRVADADAPPCLSLAVAVARFLHRCQLAFIAHQREAGIAEGSVGHAHTGPVQTVFAASAGLAGNLHGLLMAFESPAGITHGIVYIPEIAERAAFCQPVAGDAGGADLSGKQRDALRRIETLLSRMGDGIHESDKEAGRLCIGAGVEPCDGGLNFRAHAVEERETCTLAISSVHIKPLRLHGDGSALAGLSMMKGGHEVRVADGDQAGKAERLQTPSTPGESSFNVSPEA